MKRSFTLAETASLHDLERYLTRASKMDPKGVVRLRAFGDILAIYVAPIFTSNLIEDGPTAIGLRTMKLANPTEIDAIVEISAVLARLPRAAELQLELPESQEVSSWTGISPPRSGWESVGKIPEATITKWAKDGITEVATSLPDNVGGPVAARIRAQIWSRPVDIRLMLPGAAAFAMAGLGFLTRDEEIKIFRSGLWLRLSSKHGHVLTKESKRLI